MHINFYVMMDNLCNLFVNNRQNFCNRLKDNSVAVFSANELMPRNGDQFYAFRQNSDFFYLTGIDKEGAYLILCPNHPVESMREILFIEPYSESKVIWQGEMLDAKKASALSGICNVMYSDSFDGVLQSIVITCDNIYLNSYEYPKYQCDVVTIQQRFNNDILSKYPLHDFYRSAPLLNELRMVKSEEEILLTKTACQITDEAFKRCLKTVEPGKYEYQIQAELEYVFKQHATTNAYPPIVAGGRNACCLHYSANDKMLNNNDLLLFDIGCEYNNYSADLSRTIPVNGKFTPRQKECYSAVLRVMKEISKLYKVGSTINDINNLTYQLMEEEMIKLGLFTLDDVKNQNPKSPLYRKYLMHGMAHHIGLDVHDNVDKFVAFKPGMILTCEPGLYIREEGIGIRIENDLLITDNEPINLFENTPIEIEEIEYEMNK